MLGYPIHILGSTFHPCVAQYWFGFSMSWIRPTSKIAKATLLLLFILCRSVCGQSTSCLTSGSSGSGHPTHWLASSSYCGGGIVKVPIILKSKVTAAKSWFCFIILYVSQIKRLGQPFKAPNFGGHSFFTQLYPQIC